MNTIKVLFITPEYGSRFCGGLGTVVNEISPFLAEEVELDVMLLPQKKTGDLFGGWIESSIYQLRNGQVTTLHYHFFKTALKQIGKYDIVHFFHYSKEILEIMKFIRRKFPRVKIVFSCHYLLKYEQDIRCIYPQLLKIEEDIYRTTDAVHVLTQASRTALEKCYPWTRQQTTVFIIPNGIRKNNFSQPMENLLADRTRQTDKIVLAITRWCHGKGLECLLDAVPYVLKKEKNVKFVIGGRKINSWENKVEEYVQMIDEKIALYPENVIPLDWLDKKQMASLYQSSHIWVMPSQLEYFPYSLLEPMIYQLPIITARFPGFAEIISEGTECLAFNPGAPLELAEQILSLLSSPGKREFLKLNAYEKAFTAYQWTLIAKYYREMYQAVLQPVDVLFNRDLQALPPDHPGLKSPGIKLIP